MFAFSERTTAFPTDTKAGGQKEIKEPKDIKESATASKDVKDAIKAAKETKKNKKDCARECGTVYDPICAHDPSDANIKPRTFGTQCAMEVHNCEMGSSEYIIESNLSFLFPSFSSFLLKFEKLILFLTRNIIYD